MSATGRLLHDTLVAYRIFIKASTRHLWELKNAGLSALFFTTLVSIDVEFVEKGLAVVSL